MREAPPSALPGPALRCRSGRSSFGKPSNWLSVRYADHSSPPARGEIGCHNDFRQPRTPANGRRRKSCRSPPLRGRCPAGHRGVAWRSRSLKWQRSQRLRRVIPLSLVEAVLDLGLVDDLELAALDLGDVLDAEALVDLAVEGLGALRMLRPLGELLQRLGRLDQLGAVLRSLVAGIFHRLLDDIERFPAAEHVRGGGDVLGIAYGGAVVIDADGGAVGFLRGGIVGLRVARRTLPEMAAVEEFEARAVDVGSLERIHEAEELRPLRTVELAELLHEGEHGRADHDVVNH